MKFVFICVALICLLQCPASGQEPFDASKLPNEIVVTDSIRITKLGATGLPDEGYVLENDLKVAPFPDCPQGTKIEQKKGAGFAGLRITFPDGRVLKPGLLNGDNVDVDSLALWQLCYFEPFNATSIKILDHLESLPSEEIQKVDFNEFRKLLANAEGKLNALSIAILLRRFAKLQQPALSIEELVALTKSKREAISSMDCSIQSHWTASRKDLDRGEQSFVITRFVLSEHGHLLDRKNGRSLKESMKREIRAYDGENLRILNEDGTGYTKGHILPFDGYRWYFQDDNPLWASMLLNTSLDSDGMSTANDLSERTNLLFALQAPLEFEGVPCFVAVESTCETAYFFDPSKNYALMGIEQGRFSLNEKNGKFAESTDYHIRSLRKHQDCGNGIWLPLEIHRVWYEKGEVVQKCESTVSDLTVNQEIPESIFTSFIPDGTLVNDTINRVAFREGEDPSVAKTLHVPKRKSKYLNLIIANVFAVIVIVFIYFYRKKSQRT